MKAFLLSLILMTVGVAHAGQTAQLKNAEHIFEAVYEAFPQEFEWIGNSFGREFSVRSFECMSNADEDQCEILTFDNRTVRLHADSDAAISAIISRVFAELKRGGVKPIIIGSGGTRVVKISLKNFDIAYLEPKPQSPMDHPKTSYSASYEK